MVSILLNNLSGQITSNNWMNICNCPNKLYVEFQKIDTTIYYLEEDVNIAYNQSYGPPAIGRETIEEHYKGNFLLKYPQKVIEQINCILSEYPSDINPRSLMLVSHLILKIEDFRYTKFLELTLENLERGNFNCFYKVDCEEIFTSLFFPNDGAIHIKEGYLLKNYKEKNFQELLNKVYNSTFLTKYRKEQIKKEIDFLNNKNSGKK